MQSHPKLDGPAQPAQSSSTAASSSPASTALPKRRHRVDSNPQAQWSPSSFPPDPKRVRSGEHHPSAALAPGSANRSQPGITMSAKLQGKRPEIVDLTINKRPSPFQPHAGARKLVIKNLRTTAPRAAGVDEYYRQTWAELESALAAVFAGQHPKQPLERLYRGVEDICRNGQAEKLYEMLRDRCEAYLSDNVLAKIKEDGGAGVGDDVAMVRSVLAHWKTWSAQSMLIRGIFAYLDRSFLITRKDLPQINDMTISQFRRAVMVARSKDPAGAGPGPRLISGMVELVALDRAEDERFDAGLLKDSISMLHVFNIYGKSFEPRFLEQSVGYFEDFASERSSSSSLKDYILACEKLLGREDHRCIAYNFDSTTKRQLLDKAHDILIDRYSSKLLDSGSVAKLLDDNDVESMRALFELLHLSGIQKRLKEPWESYIMQAGSTIVNDTTRGDEMVIRLLELRRTLDVIIRDAFGGDDDFTYGLREAFGHFINDKKIASSWNTGTSKVGEMIAKYIDMLLRGGLKTLPKSLLSDSKDRAAAERSGQASTGDEDAELDRQLDQGLELFRFIEGKDVFEAFYKRDLARRLLMARSASQDAERNMLTKLKSECGASFTHNLEQMFKDQELARDEMTAYKQWCEGSGAGKPSVDLTVNVLSAAAWPTYPDVRVLLPSEVLEQVEKFDRFYKNKHTGRRLTWKHNLAHCVIKARFDKGPKELLVSAFQAAILVLFNQVENNGFLSYEQISHSTSLTGAELERTLQSLACGKIRVLSKHPKGREVSKTDTFTVNKAFVDPKYKVKINQIQLKETKEENQETHQRVAADRQFETQAAIVRIMKSRKVLAHAQLVAEVINQTKSRGAVDAGEIKANIEKLIEKDYLERDGTSYTYLA